MTRYPAVMIGTSESFLCLAGLMAENEALKRDKMQLQNSLENLKKTHEVTARDLACSYDLLSEAYRLNGKLQAEKKSLEAQCALLAKSQKESELSERAKSKELTDLKKDHKALQDERVGDLERLGEAVAEKNAVLQEAGALLDLVAPEAQPRSVRERLRDAKAVAIQYMKNALKKSIADLLAVVKSHYPAVDNEVVGAGPPPDCEEEKFNELMGGAKSVAEKLANEFEF